MSLALKTHDHEPDEPHGSPLIDPGRIEIMDNETQMTIEAALPGVGPEQMEVSIRGDSLTIRAERRHVRQIEKEGRQWQEFSHSSYSRSVQLPRTARADAAGASFGNGVLTVTIPKGESTPPKRIEVTKQ
ncbi:MAG: Hsp20/alpha crystallin family protein [Actinobacteria bacterium]|nr:Hsp20/alpha crystallin family protein [Actinomycetota bacterium]